MNINVARSAGFCFGVRRALTIALDLAGSRKKVEMLGDIVHNEEVVRQIEQAGIRKIKRLAKGKGKTLLVRAHGADKNVFARAARLGYAIVDATCPMVKEIHRRALAMERKGFQIVIIGDKQHDEVRGISGQLTGKAVVIDAAGRIPWRAIDVRRKTAVMCQSTQNLEKVTRVVKALRAKISRLEFFNTICSPTRIKQQEIRSMPLHNDVMVVIGSHTSANTKRLYEIARSLNPRSYWIQSPAELKAAWLKGAKTVGITSGSSTPEESTCAVIDAIMKIAA